MRKRGCFKCGASCGVPNCRVCEGRVPCDKCKSAEEYGRKFGGKRK